MKRLLILTLALSLATQALAQKATRGALSLPEPTTRGSFEGSWYYVDPGYQIALFVWRDKAGALRTRYQLRSKQGAEFRTDDGGFAKYVDRGQPAEVLFTGGLGDGDRIRGRHERTLQSPGGTYRESGDFEVYRAEEGKKLVLLYPEWKIELTDPDGRVTTTTKTDVNRIFRKASDIVVEFDEIPW